MQMAENCQPNDSKAGARGRLCQFIVINGRFGVKVLAMKVGLQTISAPAAKGTRRGGGETAGE